MAKKELWRKRVTMLYSSITNKMQRYTMVFITINALHVSGGFSAHHQELKTVYKASGICRAFTASNLLHLVVILKYINDARSHESKI
jgi:hypothetical protein